MKKVVLNDIEKLEQERWNLYLLDELSNKYRKSPNSFLQKILFRKKCLNKAALDVSMGQGRNSLWLAKRGFDTTGFDISTKAMKVAETKSKKENLPLKTKLSSSRLFSFKPNQWDLILFCYAGCLEKYNIDDIKKSLRKNGLIIFEFFHEDFGKKIGREKFGCSKKELKALFDKDISFKIIHFEICNEIADFGLQKAKIIKMAVQKVT